ncbi:hypothetical protein DPMN_034863 [Dreissena polymorpha]|uniref:Uncharacterized protein n=1 Tax=Dreissena polymorpha TaxID=45954 RepID=A0A9D4M8B7_DREPO|nr:hypothetical protein DPMN_034863 [Dreissena polymorpha]
MNPERLKDGTTFFRSQNRVLILKNAKVFVVVNTNSLISTAIARKQNTYTFVLRSL